MIETMFAYFTIGESTTHEYTTRLLAKVQALNKVGTDVEHLMELLEGVISTTFNAFEEIKEATGTISIQPYNLLDSVMSYDTVLLKYNNFIQNFADTAKSLATNTIEIGHSDPMFDAHLSQNVSLMQISNTVQETLLAIIAQDMLQDDVDDMYLKEQIAVTLRHKESYVENNEAMLATLSKQCVVLELVLDKITSTVQNDKVELLAEIETMLMSSPFNLPVELFVAKNVDDVQIDTLIDEITDAVSRVYQEYPTVNEITKELSHSDVFRLAVDNQEGFLATLNTLKAVCNNYFDVYEDVLQIVSGNRPYEAIDLTDQTVLNERTRVTALLIGAPYFLSTNLFQLPNDVMLNEEALKLQAAQLSQWLDLVADTERNGVRYNSEFVRDIVKSIQDTPENISYTNYKVFRMCADLAIKGLEITDNDLINWLTAASETSPALLQAKNEVMSGKTKLLTKQCVIKDWLNHHGMVDPNILAITETMRGKAKSASKYTAKYLQETLSSAAKAVASLFTIYPMAFKIEGPLSPVALDSNTVFAYSKVFPDMFKVTYHNTEEAKVEKRIADLAVFLCGKIVGIEMQTWEGAKNSAEIPDLPITVTRVEQLSGFTEKINGVINKFLVSKGEFESASKDVVQANMLKEKEARSVKNTSGSINNLDERITLKSKERDKVANELNILGKQLDTNNKLLKSEQELITLLRNFKEKLTVLGEKYKKENFEALRNDKEYVEFVRNRLIQHYPHRFDFLIEDKLSYRALMDRLNQISTEIKDQYKKVSAIITEDRDEYTKKKQDLQDLQASLDTEMALKRDLHDEVKNMASMDNTVKAAKIALDRASHTFETNSTILVDLTRNKIVPIVLGFGVKFTPEFAALLK